MVKFLLGVCALALVWMHPVTAEELSLKPGHPERYVVRDGDTLWDIASMFLTDAWLWPELWHINAEIENPHLIYPGDIITLTYVDGRPQVMVERNNAVQQVVKLSPGRSPDNSTEKAVQKIRVTPLSSAIDAIPLEAVSSLLTTGRIVEQHTLDGAPYILHGKSDRLIFGPGDGFYARGDWPVGNSVYGVFREGAVYQDPETREVLGFEAPEVGLARVTDRDEDLYTMEVLSVKQDIRIGDRLLPTEERRVQSTFHPVAPDQDVEGEIMTVMGGVTQVGRNDVVAVNRGLADGLVVGSVLAIHKRGDVIRDERSRDRIQLPIERAGILMVFRLFERMSYGLVLETEEPLRVGDIVTNP